MPLKWTEEEIADLWELYPDNNTEDVAIVLGRTPNAVNNQAHNHGIKKSAEFMKREKRRVAKAGESHRFAKGLIPWNTATVGVCGQHPNSRKTQFKKGNLPKNTLTDGAVTIRTDKRGVRQEFIRIGLGKWVPLARYNYEKFVGPIPKGYVVRFRDGDTMNCDPSNLECVSQRLNMLINSKYKYTRDQAEVKEACCIINDIIKGKSNGHEKHNGRSQGSPVRGDREAEGS